MRTVVKLSTANQIEKQRIRFAIAISCLATLLVSNAAVSEEMDMFFDKSPAELAAMPVTIATGTATPLLKSAAVTTVITAEQIKSMGATELHEVLDTVPGFHASVQSSTGDVNYTVRGMRNATNSQLLVLLNGTRTTVPYLGSNMTGMELPIEAIQKIEVIRGPGSALYGADAFAGVINIITKKAKDIAGVNVGGRVGDHDSQSGWGQYGEQWAGWDVAANFQYQNTGGDQGRVLKSDQQTVLDKAFGSNASHAPGALNTQYKTFNGHLNLQRKHWDLGFWAFNAEGGTRAGNTVALDPNGKVNAEQYLGDVRFSTEDWFEQWEFLAHASYLRADFQANLQVFPDNAVVSIDSDGNTLPRANAIGTRTFVNGINASVGRVEDIPALELSAIFKGWNNHLLRVTTGFRYEQITTSDYRNFGKGIIDSNSPAVIDGTLTNITGTPYAYLADTQRNILSAAFQDEWQLADDWQLTAGVRYDHYSDFGGTVNPRAALVWNINQKLTTKWLYGQAFRAPAFAELGAQNNPVRLGNENLKPETIQTYEWAFDYRPFSSLRTAVNLYYYQIKDLIALMPDNAKATSTFQNTGKQDGYGTEFEWHWQVNTQWSAVGNYAWQKAINQQTNNRVSGVPEHQVYAAAIWQFLPKWQLQPQINWIGSRINPITENGPLNDYQTIDFTLRGKKIYGQLNIAASLRNAFDATPSEPVGAKIGDNFPMPGRSFYLEASIHF
jgi:iron complex outermembrane receptor protein